MINVISVASLCGLAWNLVHWRCWTVVLQQTWTALLSPLRRLFFTQICLFVCFNNFTQILTDFRENFIRDISLDKEVPIKFWNSSASGFGSRHFLKHSSTLQDRTSSTGRISGKFYPRCRPIAGKGIPPINLGSHPHLDSSARSALAEVCTLQVLLFLLHWSGPVFLKTIWAYLPRLLATEF